jgi:hypothetical protein
MAVLLLMICLGLKVVVVVDDALVVILVVAW